MRHNLPKLDQITAREVTEKQGNTLVETLRKIYGEEFLQGWPGNIRLAEVREKTDMSLIELVRQHHRASARTSINAPPRPCRPPLDGA